MSTFNNTTNTTPNFDNLLLQSLLNRLQIHPQPPPTTAAAATTDNNNNDLQDFLSQQLLNSLSDSDTNEFDFNYDYDEDEDDEDGNEDGDSNNNRKKRSRLSKEESRLEKEIVKVILSGKTGELKPNSGQAVSIGDHHVCVGFHDGENGSGYRVWEWHGHIMLFDDDVGYTPEYIYGNYFERVSIASVGNKKKNDDDDDDEKKEQNGNLGLRELIQNFSDKGGSNRVLHRSRNAGSPSVLDGSSEK